MSNPYLENLRVFTQLAFRFTYIEVQVDRSIAWWKGESKLPDNYITKLASILNVGV